MLGPVLIDLALENLHIIRRVRQIVRKWWSLELAFTDQTGYVVDHQKGVVIPPHNPICQSCLRTKEGFARCNRSVEKAIAQLTPGPEGARRLGPCHLGVDIVAAPIAIDGQTQGALFACGFLLDGGPEREERVAAGARALGLERVVPDLDAAAKRLVRLDARDADRFFDLVTTCATEAAEVAARRGLSQTISALAPETAGFGAIIGKSAPMKRLFAVLERVVETDTTVLVSGENGTGKELVARAIHFGGPRKDQPFLAQNCSALNDNLLESELFGHVLGSFTGATREKKGLFKAADGGTFFLDEVGDMSPAMQVKILRVLEEGMFLPVGATRPEQVDVRVIAATNRTLKDLVQRRLFREDLYFRLNVIHIEVPPLRERVEDIPLLCDHFLTRISRRTRRTKKRLSPELMRDLFASRWAGNVRELENTIERLAVLAGDREVIGREVRELQGEKQEDEPALAKAAERGHLTAAVQALEREMIQAGLIQTHWNKSKLAEKLGLSRTTLIKKIKEYGLEDELDEP